MSKLAELYASEVVAGRKKITEVPTMLKKKVQELVKEQKESAGE